MPIINFKTFGVDAPLGSNDRAILFLLTHCGFWFFNFVNVCTLLLVQGLVFGRLRKNYLSKLALAACTIQLMSCVCSIHRSNMNDEFGFFGHVSTVLGLLAYCPFNIAVLHLLLNRNINCCLGGDKSTGTGKYFRVRYLHIGVAFSLLAAVGCFLVGYIDWEANNFDYFRKFIGISTVYQVLAMIVGLWNFCNRKINLDPSILSRNATIKIFVVCIGLDLLALALAGSGMTIVQYPATGLTFTVLCIVMAFVGEMDFMQPEYRTTTAHFVQPEHYATATTARFVPECYPAAATAHFVPEYHTTTTTPAFLDAEAVADCKKMTKEERFPLVGAVVDQYQYS